MATHVVRAERLGRRKGQQALRYAKALLCQPDPDLEQAAVVLVEALLQADLTQREQAARLLARLGARSLPPLLYAWQWADDDGRKAILITWGLMGPTATPALPLLAPCRADDLLGPYVQAALERIQPPVLAGILQAARSPWTWSRLLDLLLAGLSHPVTIAVSFLSTGISLLHWYGTLAARPHEIVPAVSASFALLGASLGALIGLKLDGIAQANSSAKLWGMAGSVAGTLMGSFAAAVVLPILQALTIR